MLQFSSVVYFATLENWSEVTEESLKFKAGINLQVSYVILLPTKTQSE